jgi:hypothetical protein
LSVARFFAAVFWCAAARFYSTLCCVPPLGFTQLFYSTLCYRCPGRFISLPFCPYRFRTSSASASASPSFHLPSPSSSPLPPLGTTTCSSCSTRPRVSAASGHARGAPREFGGGMCDFIRRGRAPCMCTFQTYVCFLKGCTLHVRYMKFEGMRDDLLNGTCLRNVLSDSNML